MPDLDQIEQFLSRLQTQKGFSGNTLAAYRNDLTQFAEYLGSGHGAAGQGGTGTAGRPSGHRPGRLPPRHGGSLSRVEKVLTKSRS